MPAMPLSDVDGNRGTLPPAQITIEVPKLKVGTVFGVTVIVNVVVVAHWPAAGVNVYVPEIWSLGIEGLQVPVMPLSEVVGNEGTPAPAQMVIDVPKLNVGVTLGLTVTVNVVVVAHCPGSGVNV